MRRMSFRSIAGCIGRPTHVPLVAFVLAATFSLITIGCVSPTKALRLDAEVDSLRSANKTLHSQVNVLTDSLYYIDYVDSGQYNREFRTLQNETKRLEYNLSVCQDGGLVLGSELVDNLFEPSSARLTKNGRGRLDVLSASLSDHPEAQIRVHGHADTSKPGATLTKTYPTNWELTGARAAAVTRYLIDNHGIEPNRIAAVSFGAARPVATNRTGAGRKQNRRIEIVLQ